MSHQRLGVNIDHVATIRNARGGMHPDPVRAALRAIEAGAEGITAHLREDRRHIVDSDMFLLKERISVPLNFEMAATEEMQGIALQLMPHAVCLVPEKREERTTEGGLDVVAQREALRAFIAPLNDAGIRVSMFIDPVEAQLEASLAIGAGAVELHTGAYAEGKPGELEALRRIAALTQGTGIECHAGHGLSYGNVSLIAAIPEIVELNIGHYLIGEAIFTGIIPAVQRMRGLMDEARL